MPEQHDLTPDETRFAERVAESLRRAPGLDDAFDARLRAALRAEPAPRRAREGMLRWLARPRTIRVSPLAGLAAAAAVALAVLAGRGGEAPAAPAPVTAAAGAQPMQFVFYAPSASSVTLVGDFNDWDRRATPLARGGGEGVWTVTVPLAPGRHQYAFVVDGREWRPDPEAPRALADDFGQPNSVVLVGGRS